MDKQKQIEEMADILCESKNHNCNGEDCKCIKQATDLYNANCRILDEGSVVLSKKEYEALSLIEKYHIKSCGKNSVVLTTEELEEIRKQAVKEFVQAINKEYEDEIFSSCLREDIKRIAKEFGVELQKCAKIRKNTQKQPNFENHTGDPDWN